MTDEFSFFRLWMALTWLFGLPCPSLSTQLCSTAFLMTGPSWRRPPRSPLGLSSCAESLAHQGFRDPSATLTWFCPPVKVVCRGVAAAACRQLLGATGESWMSGGDQKWTNYSPRGARQVPPLEVLPLPDTPYTPHRHQHQRWKPGWPPQVKIVPCVS